MDGREIARRGIRLTATVRVRGPDPRGDIAASSAFFAVSDSGPESITELSASALRLPLGSGAGPGATAEPSARDADAEHEYLLAPLALFVPFFGPRGGANAARLLAPGVEVHVRRGASQSSVPEWIPATPLGAVVPPDAAAAVESLVGPRGLGALHRGWFVGGAAPVAPGFAASRRRTDASSAFAPGDAPLSVGVAVAGLVIIRVPAPSPGTNDRSPGTLWSPGASPRPGDAVMACGSPFGVLAPSHFAASVLSGSVSGTWRAPGTPPGPERDEKSIPGIPGDDASTPTPLLMLDARTLPGMEGGPVLDATGALLGILTPPLARSTRAAREQRVPASSNPADDADGADVAPLALSIACVRRALLDFSRRSADAPNARVVDVAPTVSPASENSSKNAAADAGVRTVVLIETDDGASWASGVIVRAGRPGGAEGPARSALALTNAHVVRPSAVAVGGDGAGPDARVVRVRTATGRWTVAAPIHISEGPLDVAVLAFAAASEDVGFVSAAVNPGADADPGDPVVVLGHGRVGPNAPTAPTPLVSPGMVSAVVRRATDPRDVVMLRTTAAVHSGASGGAAVSPEDGRFLGLVTSNARRGRGRETLPHLNFCVPAGMLAPVWRAAERWEDDGDGPRGRVFETCLADAQADPEVRAAWRLRDPARVAASKL